MRIEDDMKYITVKLTEDQHRLVLRALQGHYLDCDPKEAPYIARTIRKLAQAKIS